MQSVAGLLDSLKHAIDICIRQVARLQFRGDFGHVIFDIRAAFREISQPVKQVGRAAASICLQS